MLAALVFAAAFATYAMTAAPALGWLDSSEFVAAAASLGVPHSPGHPLYVLLGQAAALIPLGDIATRVALLSAALTAAAVVCLRTTAKNLVGALAPASSQLSRQVLATSFALAIAVSVTVWGQAVRAEVYSLELLLFALAVEAAFSYWKTPRSRVAVRFALCIGLGLATHHFITLGFAIPLTAIMLLRRKPGSSELGLSVAAGALGLAAFAYLPIRAATNPVVNWGNPDSLGRLLWTISGRAFTKTMTEGHSSGSGAEGMQIIAALVSSGPLLLLLSLLALYLSLRLGRGRRITATCAAIAALAVLGRLVLGFDPETPDHYAYLIPASVSLAILSLVAVSVLMHALPRRSWHVSIVGSLSIAASAVMTLAPTLEQVDSSEAYAADEIARLSIAELPPGSLLLTSYFQTSFRTSALRTVEGARPDVAVIDRSFLSYPGHAQAAIERYPELAPLIDAGLGPGRPSPLDVLSKLAQERAVFVELHSNLARRDHYLFGPQGAFARFDRRPNWPAVEAFRQKVDQVTRDARHSDRQWATAHALWLDFVVLQHACEVGTQHAASRALEHALELAPNDEMLLELGERCGLRP